MDKVFIKYPDTPHFKEFCSALYRNKVEELNIHGTIKLHGTNFSMVLDGETEQVYFQKRTSVLNEYVVMADGVEKTCFTKFFDWENVVNDSYTIFARWFTEGLSYFHKVCFFGELVGEEIQKGVAVQELSKRFVIFDVAIIMSKDDLSDSRKWKWINGDLLKRLFNDAKDTMIGLHGEDSFPDNLFCIEDFPTWDLKLNVFDNVSLRELQNELQGITEQVEKECPFAKAFGVSGTGEGVVWKANGYRFKVKGEEHTTSKVRTLNKVELEKIEQLKTINEFADAICTEARFKQGVQYLRENEVEGSKVSAYIKWIIQDTFKEELDFITEKNLDHSELKKVLSSKAKKYLHLNPVE